MKSIEKVKVSIIVPVYNVEKYIQRCVESIRTQSYQNLEIILIDDGSKDLSLDLCYKMAELDSRICVLHQENQGVSVARNQGLDIASGEYVGFVDSDDEIEPDMVRCMVRKLLEENSDVCCCGDVFLDIYDQEISHTVVEEAKKNSRDSLLAFLKFLIPGGVCNKIFNLQLIRDNNLRFRKEISINEDLLFFAEYILFSEYGCSFINATFYKYYKNEVSVTHCIEEMFEERRLSGVIAAEILGNKIDSEDREIVKAWKVYYGSRIIDAMLYLRSYKEDVRVKKIQKMYRSIIRSLLMPILQSKELSWKYKLLIILSSIGLY